MTINRLRGADCISITAALALLLLLGAATVPAAEPPQLDAEMGMDVESPATTKELLALVLELNEQIGSGTTGGWNSGYRSVTSIDQGIYTITIEGRPLAEGVSEYTARLTYLPPSSERLVGQDFIAESSNFVKAHHIHVIETGMKVLDWAVEEIKRVESRRSNPGD